MVKLQCETKVERRGENGKGRFMKSTLALGRKDEKSNLCLILTNAGNTGTKYGKFSFGMYQPRINSGISDLTSNVNKVFTGFVNEGKATISLKLPNVDIQIKSERIQLKAFLKVMSSEMCPQAANKQDALKSDNRLLRAFGSTCKAVEVVTKMIVKERSAFPQKGFPRTLKDLTINIGCGQMPIGILNLTSLNHLNLANNRISRLPKALGNLKLSSITLDDNQLGDSVHASDWDWLKGDTLSQHLTSFVISRNKLKYLPPNVFKCLRLGTLDASFNEISRIPFAIKGMTHLKFLSLNNNNLASLPYTIVKPRFDMIDLSNNKFMPAADTEVVIQQSHQSLSSLQYRAPSLLEISSRAVIKHRIPYMYQLIPPIIKDILFHSPLCANSKCEVLCFDMEIHQNINWVSLNCKQRITSDNAKHFVADGPFCSKSCSDKTKLLCSQRLN